MSGQWELRICSTHPFVLGQLAANALEVPDLLRVIRVTGELGVERGEGRSVVLGQS